MIDVIDAAVEKAYGGEKKILGWKFSVARVSQRLRRRPVAAEETLEALKEFKVSIKGPLTTPVGGGIRSLNVAIRQQLDLYSWSAPCVISTAYFAFKQPELTDMIIFRENSEDIYAGIEWAAGTPEADA